MTCTCGIPSEANYHTEIIIGRGDSSTSTETTDVQLYQCAEHVREWEPGDLYKAPRDGGWSWETEEWEVLESTTTHLRGDV